MAKHSKVYQDKVEKVMHEFKEGTLESGKNGVGGKVENPKQAIAIALSEANKEEIKMSAEVETTKAKVALKPKKKKS